MTGREGLGPSLFCREGADLSLPNAPGCAIVESVKSAAEACPSGGPGPRGGTRRFGAFELVRR